MNHKELNCWKKAIDFVATIYKATEKFPECERFGLITQIRRAAISIPSNIAEGAARKSDKEFIHFLFISLGSASELETQIIIAKSLNYLKSDHDLIEGLKEIQKMIQGLINYLKRK